MRIRVLGGDGGESLNSRMTCLLVNDVVALDAGSLTQGLSIEEQVAVRSIVLSHSHMDHTNSLPFFIENVFGKTDRPIDIHASAATIYAIRKYLFNNEVWPDFSRLPNHLLPSVRFEELETEVPRVIDGVKFTPILVNHVIPTFGFRIEQEGVAVLWSSDTGPTQRLWEVANETPNLKAVFIETSFDNSMQDVADISQHLTPRTLQGELNKLSRPVPILLHHLKPPCVQRIRAEIRDLGNPDIEFLEQGRTYEFL
ncbi:MAG: 3',5'-cyclic-nucleotide phosphodiesterase [Deltaproteobacteria bacterium]|nr:3',5'-cyclic-nucleotide phosphodiesterase [Deltaproteobacteria bacterium]